MKKFNIGDPIECYKEAGVFNINDRLHLVANNCSGVVIDNAPEGYGKEVVLVLWDKQNYCVHGSNQVLLYTSFKYTINTCYIKINIQRLRDSKLNQLV